MSNRKTTVFYAMLIAVASLAVGMVIASRLDLQAGRIASDDWVGQAQRLLREGREGSASS